MLSGDMEQVESGEQTWGIKKNQSLWALVNDKWVNQNEQMSYVSSGKAGTWGIQTGDNVLVRDGRYKIYNLCTFE